jgi:GT2 family glycosyltransferase
MKLAVVVPVYNGGADLRACLEAVARSTRRPDEIIVADDGSTDGAPGCAAEFGAKVVTVGKTPSGPARARNRGAAKTKADLLVFVDADVEIHADALARFEQVFAADPELAAAFGSYDDQPSATGTVSRFKNLLHHYVHQHGGGEAETFWAGCGAIRREAFVAVDGFSESFAKPSIEDIELGARLCAAGRRVRLCPEILGTHRKRWTFGSLVRTDIFARAVPWTRLILQQGALPSGLNTDRNSRWSAAMAGLLAAGVVLGAASASLGRWPVVLAALGSAALAATVLALLNRRLYRFFAGHGGSRFALGAACLHALYLLYSSAVFVALLVVERLTGGADVTPAVESSTRKPRLATSARRKGVVGVLVFALLFAIYVGDGSPLPGKDATPNVHLAANLLAHGTLLYTPEQNPGFFRWKLLRGGVMQTVRFRSWSDRVEGLAARELKARGELRYPTAPYYFAPTSRPEAYVSSYGAATGLFALPFVGAVYPFVQNLDERVDLLWLLSKLAAAFAVAGSACLLFLVAVEHLRRSSALILTLAYGLGTCAWSVSSQALWQHAPGEFFLALGMFGLFRRERRFGPGLAGAAFALAFLCRPTNSLAVMTGFVVLLGDRRALVRYCLGALPMGVLFFAYNLHYFGKLIAFGQVTALAARVSAGNAQLLWQHSLASGLAGLLVSPSRGLFVYSPIFVVSAWGALRLWRERRWLPLRAAALAALGIWVVTARWRGWWGGWSFGYRLVVDTSLLLAFVAIPVIEKLRAGRWLRVLIVTLLGWSVGVQVVGVVAYDIVGWDGKQGYVVTSAGDPDEAPYFGTLEEAAAYCRSRGCNYGPMTMSIDKRRFNSRLWSIRDSQLLYLLQNFKESHRRRSASLRQFLFSEG